MKLLQILWANVAHATHAMRHGLAKHRMLTHSIKPSGKLLHVTAQIKCDCGKVFYTNSQAVAQYNEIVGEQA